MKKVLNILYLFILILVFTSCFSEQIENTKDGYGELSVSGIWPTESSDEVEDSSISKSISPEAETISFTLTSSSDSSVVKSSSVSRSSDETYFTLSFEDVEIGQWIVKGEAFDGSGNSLGTIRSKTVTVSSGLNKFSAVFGPVTYSELFLPDSFAKLMGDYTHHFSVITYLEIDQIDYYGGEAFWISGSDYIKRNEFMDWNHFDSLESTTDTAIFVNEFGSAPDWDISTDILAVADYSYDINDRVAGAVYTNDENAGYGITSGFGFDVSIDTSVTHNSNDRITGLSTSGSSSSSAISFSETVTATYFNGNIIYAYFNSNGETNSITFSYSNGKIISYTETSDSGSESETVTITWDDSNLSEIDQIVRSSTDKSSTTTLTYNSTTGKLEQASESGTDSSGSYTKTFTYDYTTSGNNSYGHLKTIEIAQNGSKTYEVGFTYNATNNHRVEEVTYTYSDDNWSSSEEMFSEKITYVGYE